MDLDGLSPWIDAALLGMRLVEEMVEDAAYAPYLERQERELRELRASESLPLPENFPYAEIAGLSREMVERLTKARPATLAAAGRIPGILRQRWRRCWSMPAGRRRDNYRRRSKGLAPRPSRM